jgi:prolipoprotein diacylglyceryl transferase
MRRRGAPPWAVLDIAVWAVPFGIVGARIYHVITSPDDYFGDGGVPLDALKIWHGGLGIWGAIAGGAVGAWIAVRRMGIPLAFVADALAPGLALAQGIGRWGNWFNNELAGRSTSLPWGLKLYEWNPDQGKALTDVAGDPIAKAGLYQPTFLYESIWDIGVAVLVWQLDRRYRFGRGRAFALYAMAYTAGRFWIEALRDDEAHHFLGMRLNSWTAIVVFLGALIYFVRVRGPQVRLVTTPEGELEVVPVDGSTGPGGRVDGEAGAATPVPDTVTGDAAPEDGAEPVDATVPGTGPPEPPEAGDAGPTEARPTGAGPTGAGPTGAGPTGAGEAGSTGEAPEPAEAGSAAEPGSPDPAPANAGETRPSSQ